jgi:predicted transcriptional regulator
MSSKSDLVETAAGVVAAYVGNNHLAVADLPDVIRSVYRSLNSLQPVPPEEPEPLVPAVPIKKSITPDYLISLEDGQKYRALKRHLSVRGLTPQQYRSKWDLPPDYPMVAPNYSAARSDLAKSLGLGKKTSSNGRTPPSRPKRGR